MPPYILILVFSRFILNVAEKATIDEFIHATMFHS
jgi:hypothetical protein